MRRAPSRSHLQTRVDRWLFEHAEAALADARRSVILERDKSDDADDTSDDQSADETDEEDVKGGSAADSKKASMQKTPDKSARDTRGGQQQAKAARRQTPTPDPDDITLELVVKKLNAIRSGPSFKDEGVRQRIADYFKELQASERLALFAFLEGLAEVVAANVDGDDARMPSDPDINVDMEAAPTRDEREEARPQPRVVKHGDKPTGRMKQQADKVGTSDAPPKQQDAYSRTPVMVVKR